MHSNQMFSFQNFKPLMHDSRTVFFDMIKPKREEYFVKPKLKDCFVKKYFNL